MRFRVRGVATRSDREAVRSLLRKEFEVADGVGGAFASLYDHLLDLDPATTLDCSRVAVEDGRVIGHALLAPRNIRICYGDCPSGLIGMVVVAPDRRGRGVGSALVSDVHRKAADLGLGLLVLAGDPRYYNRFGYHQAYVKTVGRATVAAAVRPSGVRDATADDVDVLTRLSGANVPPGSVSPDRARWTWMLKTRHPHGLLAANPVTFGFRSVDDWCLLDLDGRSYARVAVGERRAAVYEAGAVDDDGGRRMLQAVAAKCAAVGVTELELRLDPGTRPAPSAGVETKMVDDPEFQFRIVDLDVLLASAERGLAARIDAALPNWEGGVLIRTESDTIRISREGGVLGLRRVAGAGGDARTGSLTLPVWGVGRMLMGQTDVAEALARSGGEGELDRVLKALFPGDLPSFRLADAI